MRLLEKSRKKYHGSIMKDYRSIIKNVSGSAFIPCIIQKKTVTAD